MLGLNGGGMSRWPIAGVADASATGMSSFRPFRRGTMAGTVALVRRRVRDPDATRPLPLPIEPKRDADTQHFIQKRTPWKSPI